MNKKKEGKFTKEKYNLKNRKLPFLVRLKNNWQRIKKHNVHKSWEFIISCTMFSVVLLKLMQLYFFSKAFLITIPREEFQKNHLSLDVKLNKSVDQETLNNYLDKLEEMKLQREKDNKEKKQLNMIENKNNKL